MSDQLRDKCILITGASSGLGKALALKLSEQGNFVIASGRNKSALNELMVQAKGQIKPLIMDVAEQQSVDEGASELKSLTDYLDLVICCAGVCQYEDKIDFDPQTYEKIIGVNFLGLVRTLHICLPLLKRSEMEKPRIVMVGSLSSLVGFPRAEAYGASKAAVQYLAESLMGDTAKLPLAVTLVRPGFIDTAMTQENDFPMPFKVTAEDAASRIVSGLEAGKRFIDFPSRLSAPLVFMSKFKRLWLSFFAPKMSRHDKHSWRAE